MGVNAHLGVIVGMESADVAAHGLGQGRVVVRFAGVLEQAAQLHHLGGDDGVLGVAAEELVGISGGPHGALVVQRGLQGELHAGLELILMVLTDLDDVAGELMAHDGGMIGHVVMHALMGGAQGRALVGGHAQGVGDNLGKDLVVGDLRQLELVQTQVIGAMQAYGFGFHSGVPPVLKFLLITLRLGANYEL